MFSHHDNSWNLFITENCIVNFWLTAILSTNVFCLVNLSHDSWMWTNSSVMNVPVKFIYQKQIDNHGQTCEGVVCVSSHQEHDMCNLWMVATLWAQFSQARFDRKTKWHVLLCVYQCIYAMQVVGRRNIQCYIYIIMIHMLWLLHVGGHASSMSFKKWRRKTRELDNLDCQYTVLLPGKGKYVKNTRISKKYLARNLKMSIYIAFQISWIIMIIELILMSYY